MGYIKAFFTSRRWYNHCANQLRRLRKKSICGVAPARGWQALSFVIAAYFYVRLIPQDSRALHLELFTVPSHFTTFYGAIN